jgi:dTDP-4-amino-4,6-dideoxygalactose transaminase
MDAERNTMAVPFLDLRKQFAGLRQEILSAIEAVLDSQQLVLGPQQKLLEQSLAQFCQAKAGIACASGTDALLASLMALGVEPGDEVICPAFTFFATAGTIARVGARPVFVDIDPVTFNIAPAAVEAAVTPRTKGVIPVHLYGQMAEMETITKIAQKRGLFVLEDTAQAIGATRHGRPACSWGIAGALSFYPTKNLSAVGDAGMIISNDDTFTATVRTICVHGDTGGYNHVRLGGNFRMDEIHAAALNVKFKHLSKWNESRRAHAAIYDRLLAGVEGIVTPKIVPGNESVYNLYVVRAQRRAELMAFLKSRQIGSAVHYPKGLHEQPCFAQLGYRRGQFPQTEQAGQEVLALPVCPELSDAQIEEAAGVVREFYGAKA